ncbi:amidohydrolase family protein [Amycolatopsis sp. GM8]|uniref:amidohydrolase family protein n=1 Tax=Amycolatopsis sp. GM8 TaxID=2896530 RepID=UPI001F46093C|nr:amidohydrolase family protein [Amycolatopsis sp. GM8]
MKSITYVSSDGHAVARMPKWREYLPARLHQDFDDFLTVYKQYGSKNFDRPALEARLDPEEVDSFTDQLVKTGRVDGVFEMDRRLVELDREGIAGEVLFPDFGLAFQLLSPAHSSMSAINVTPTEDQEREARRAYNRWLVDYCSEAPHRFAGLALVDFDDVETALAEIRAAKESGLRGVLLPFMDDDYPVYHERNTPIWKLLEELGMPLEVHTGTSGITKRRPRLAPGTDPRFGAALSNQQWFFIARQVLDQFIMSGTLEKHPNLQLVFTEMGSYWAAATIERLDYSLSGAFLRRDIRQVVPRLASEYFARQVSLGSSLFSTAEAQARHQIGVDRMMLGADYPHHEGSINAPGTRAYLRATLGAAGVTEDEARKMMGDNIIKLFGMDRAALEAEGERIGLMPSDILTPPTENLYPRGDVHRPLVGVG